MVNIIESLVVGVATVVSFDKAKVKPPIARKRPMQAMQVQKEIFISFAYLDSSSVDSCVPSFSLLVVYPDSIRTFGHDVYQVVVYVLLKEEEVIDLNVGTIDLTVHPNLPSVIDVVRSKLVETRTSVLVVLDPS